MMKTTSYSGEPRSRPYQDINLVPAVWRLLPPGLERLGSREKGLLEDGWLRRRKGRFLASLLAVSVFDGLPKIRSINEVNNYRQIPCERSLISRLPAFQRYGKNQRRFLVRVRIIKYSLSTGQVSLFKTCILSTATGMNSSTNSVFAHIFIIVQLVSSPQLTPNLSLVLLILRTKMHFILIKNENRLKND